MNMKMQFGRHLLSLTILQIIPFSRFRRFLRIFCKFIIQYDQLAKQAGRPALCRHIQIALIDSKMNGSREGD